MINTSNIRIPTTIPKKELEYLKKIVDIYNAEVITDNFRLLHQNYKLSVSALIHLSIQRLILDIDKCIDVKKSKAINHKNIYMFLSGKKAIN